MSDALGQSFPAFPVVLAHTVLNGVDGILVDKFLQVGYLFVGGAFLAFGAFEDGVVIYAIFIELAGGAVHANLYIPSRFVAGSMDGGHDAVQCVFRTLQCGGKTSLIAYGGAEAAVVEHLLQGMEYFGAHAQAFTEGGGTYGTYHELLEGNGRIAVRAAVDDVHHGHGHHVRVHTAYIPI